MRHAGLVTSIKGICSPQPLGCFKLLLLVSEPTEGLLGQHCCVSQPELQASLNGGRVFPSVTMRLRLC